MKQVIDHLAAVWREGERIVFLGVGSPLRDDDAVGLFIVEELEKALVGRTDKELRFYLGESAPENFSGAIREFAPSDVVIFDAADLGEEPGTCALIEEDRIGGASFSTHMMPLKILTNYLTISTGCRISVVGVQPERLEFGMELTPRVREAAEKLVKEFKVKVLVS